MFVYGPKHAKKLPYYDTFPLVLPLERYSDGFLGMNFHYLPIPLRMKLLDKIFDFAGGDWPTFVVGDTVDSIRGVVHYYFGEYVIYLRDLNDLNFDSNQGCISDGDINSDGTVNVVDVVTAVNFVLGLGEPSDEQLCKGDVNGDGVLNVVDIVVIVNNILGG